MTEEQLTQEEQQLLEEAMKSYGAPEKEEKHNVHTFLNKVANSPDTTKTGNLTQEEVGITPFSLRSFKQFQLDSQDLANDDIWAEYFRKEGEILTATSLSKDAKLINLAVIQRRELADVTKPRKENKGWFSKKDKQPTDGESG